MDKYSRYYGILMFLAVVVVISIALYVVISPKVSLYTSITNEIETQESTLSQKRTAKATVESKIKKLKDSIANSQKKIYSPDAEMGSNAQDVSDTLFFTLYSDVLEMVRANSIKIKSMDYTSNPESDEFVKFGKDIYLVTDVNMELVSNYVQLGKLIQDLYQYPYYIRINDLSVTPYEKNKRILLTNLSVRLYSRTTAEDVDTPVDNTTQSSGLNLPQ
jgi:Tfp pilus assembly protein PilO